MEKDLPSRKPTRHKDFDYCTEGYYFVTICTEEMRSYFGKISKGEMKLNSMGKIVEKCWHAIPEHFKNIELDYFQIMLNHIHGIIIVNGVGNANLAFPKMNNGNAKFASPTDRTKMTLSKVIQQFKRQVTIETRSIINTKIFQRSFYDRIIRNEKELYNIRKYIVDNPLKWELEKGLPENLELSF
ncbi:MAG: transposase [Bacteroidota bacterium]